MLGFFRWKEIYSIGENAAIIRLVRIIAISSFAECIGFDVETFCGVAVAAYGDTKIKCYPRSGSAF
jgi:hypothetical protein